MKPKPLHFIDAHLHLHDYRISKNAATIVAEAEQAGVRILACNAVKEGEWQEVIDLSLQHSSIRPFLGIHPWYSDRVTSGWLNRLETILARTEAGIGEIGFDSICKIDHKTQEKIFLAQLELACQLKVPMSIHCIKSWGRMLDILKNYDLSEPRYIIHSFGGSTETMNRLLDLGALISFSTQLANPSRKKIRHAFINAPLDRILLETDSPDQYCQALCTTPKCSTENSNRPVFVTGLYDFAAKLRGLSCEHFSEIVWNNGKIFTN